MGVNRPVHRFGRFKAGSILKTVFMVNWTSFGSDRRSGPVFKSWQINGASRNRIIANDLTPITAERGFCAFLFNKMGKRKTKKEQGI